MMKNLFKIISVLFCVTGLTYQMLVLFYQYWLGKTIVNVNVQRNGLDHLPAITVCLPFLFSLKKLAAIDENFKIMYNEYQVSLENYRKSKNKTRKERDNLSYIYQHALNLVHDRLNKNKIGLREILENYTIDFKNEHGKQLMQINFYGDIKNNTVIDPIDELDSLANILNGQIVDEPVESIAFAKKHYGEIWASFKCFTFFSFLQPKWRDYQTYFEYMLVKINYDFESVPPTLYNYVFFSSHSPNNLPELNLGYYKSVYLNHQYLFEYSVLITKLLDERYDTKCFEYDIDYKHANFNMRSDCITHCYQRKMNEIVRAGGHGAVESYAPSDYLLRNEAMKQIPNIFFEHDQFIDPAIKSKVKLACFDECPKDCIHKYYSLDKEMVIQYYVEIGQIYIYIQHDAKPDVCITHIPEITFISLMCNLGGLIGMWLGISLVMVLEEFYKIMIILKNFFKSYKFKDNPVYIKIKANINVIVKRRTRKIGQLRININRNS